MKKVREGRSQGVGSSSCEKKEDTEKLEAEEGEDFEDSDKFEFEQQSFEDDDVDEDSGKTHEINFLINFAKKRADFLFYFHFNN